MRIRLTIIGAAVLAVAIAGCSKDSGDPAAGSKPAAGSQSAPAATPSGSTPAVQQVASNVMLKMSPSTHGDILTDQDGRVVYAFEPDKQQGTSNCAGACLATWPALTSRSKVTAGPGVSTNLLGSAARAEGATQATYNDWPLYFYAGDVAPGDTDGQGTNGIWWVLDKDGKLVRTS
ncbi:MAG TPA: hypothetical protein VMU51_00940 [Mycobacteriales bacterium]|nr:hypothetical protein [Mycobacteriales bacterium]